MMLPKIKSVKAIKNYVLQVAFLDGVQGDYDAGFLAGKGVFKNWNEDDNFYKVYIDAESGAIAWPGELDIDTVNVYCSIKGINADAYLSQLQHAAY